MTLHPLDRALALEAVAPGRYRAQTSPDYWNMVGPYGGSTAATMLAAVLAHPDCLGDPVSITVNYAAALAEGEFEVLAEPVRTNRSTQHWMLRMVQADPQDGRQQVLTTATVLTALRRETWSLGDEPAPAVPAAQDVPVAAKISNVAWLDHYEMRPIAGALPPAFDGVVYPDSLTRLWVRDRPARAIDFCSLLALSDVFYPRVWRRRALRVPAGTVSLTTHFHAGPEDLRATGDGYLLGQARAQAFRNGFFDPAAQLWNASGTLLCTSNQTVYYKE